MTTREAANISYEGIALVVALIVGGPSSVFAQAFYGLLGTCETQVELSIKTKLVKAKQDYGAVVVVVQRSTHSPTKFYRPAPYGYDADLVISFPPYLAGDVEILGTDAFSDKNLNTLRDTADAAWRSVDVDLGCLNIDLVLAAVLDDLAPNFLTASVRAGQYSSFSSTTTYPKKAPFLIDDGLYATFRGHYIGVFRPVLGDYVGKSKHFLRSSGWANVVAYHRTSDAKVVGMREGLFEIPRLIGRIGAQKAVYPTQELTVVQFVNDDCTSSECLDYATKYMLHHLRRYGHFDQLLDMALHVHGGNQMVDGINGVLKLTGKKALKSTYDYQQTMMSAEHVGVDFPVLADIGVGIDWQESVMRVSNESVPACGYEARVNSVSGLATAGVGLILQSPINISATWNVDPTNQNMNTDGFKDEYVPPSEMHKTVYVAFGPSASISQSLGLESGDYSLGVMAYVPKKTFLGAASWPNYKRGLFFDASGFNFGMGFDPGIELGGLSGNVMFGKAMPTVTSVRACRADIRKYVEKGTSLLDTETFGPYLVDVLGDPSPHAKLMPSDDVTQLTELLAKIIGQTPLRSTVQVKPYVVSASADRTRVRKQSANVRAQLIRAGVEAELKSRFAGEPGRRRVSYRLEDPEVISQSAFGLLGQLRSGGAADPDATLCLVVVVEQG